MIQQNQNKNPEKRKEIYKKMNEISQEASQICDCSKEYDKTIFFFEF